MTMLLPHLLLIDLIPFLFSLAFYMPCCKLLSFFGAV
jgi:hypothetical protein